MGQLTCAAIAFATTRVVAVLAYEVQHRLRDNTAVEVNLSHTPAQAAEVAIYADPELLCTQDTGHPALQLDIPINTCVSADLSLKSNVLIKHPGVCIDGRAPRVSVYASSYCVGSYTSPDGIPSASGVSYCLDRIAWDVTGRWSLALLCGDAEIDPMESVKITLPKFPAEARPRMRLRSPVALISDSTCSTPTGLAPSTQDRPARNTCIDVQPGSPIKFQKRTLCPAGARALFAGFHEAGCRGSPRVVRGVGSGDRERPCIEVGGGYRISYMLWCDGTGTDKQEELGLGDEEARLRYGL